MPFPFNLKVQRMFSRRRAIAQTTRELEQSSDRVLADLGISRRDIAAIARGGYAQPTASAAWAAEPSERRLVLAAMGRH